MVGSVAFLMKDVVLLAVSFYLLKQDLVRASLPKNTHSERPCSGGSATKNNCQVPRRKVISGDTAEVASSIADRESSDSWDSDFRLAK
jgi:hypothetical protein